MIARVVFLGSPGFAVPCLQRLAHDERIDVVLTVTQPDRPAGRGRRLAPPPVKQAAIELGIPTYQPESLRAPEDVIPLVEAAPDLLVVVAYGEILRRHVLQLAPHGALNVHPSLLPRYRGSSPVRAAILNGDDETGVSIIKLVRRLDAGPVVAQRHVAIDPDEDAAQLTDRLAGVAAEMLPGACLDWIDGTLEAVEQDQGAATMTREWTRDDARIDWSQSSQAIERLVRASQPWPVAWTTLDDKPFRIHRSFMAEGTDLAPGQVRRVDGRIAVGCGSGTIHLLDVQPAGKRAMPATNWWNGLRTDEISFDA